MAVNPKDLHGLTPKDYVLAIVAAVDPADSNPFALGPAVYKTVSSSLWVQDLMLDMDEDIIADRLIQQYLPKLITRGLVTSIGDSEICYAVLTPTGRSYVVGAGLDVLGALLFRSDFW